MSVDPVLSLIVGALGASLIGLFGAWVQYRREHAKWLREKRLEAYGSFMRDMSTLQQVFGEAPTAQNAKALEARLTGLTERFTVSGEMVSLLGPKAVNESGQRWVWAALALKDANDHTASSVMSAARWEFLVSAGKVLKSKNVGKAPLARPE